jgi:hypothetical protein
MSKKLLFTIVAVVLCVGMIGAAFSYFTDVVPSTANKVTAGYLSMEISQNNVNYNTSDTADIVLSGLAPGQTVTSNPIWLKDTGDLNSFVVFGRVCNLVDSVTGFSKYIEVTAMNDAPSGEPWETTSFDPTDSVSGQPNIAAFLDVWYGGAYSSWTYADWAADGHPYISLYDLETVANTGGSSADTGFYEYNGFTSDTTPWLTTGGPAEVSFSFALPDTIPNTYNVSGGASSSFEIDFIASTDNVGSAGGVVDNYITQPLGTINY